LTFLKLTRTCDIIVATSAEDVGYIVKSAYLSAIHQLIFLSQHSVKTFEQKYIEALLLSLLSSVH